MNYIPAASIFFKLLGLRAKSDSFGFLSGCFLFEFTPNRRLFHPALLPMPGTNHMANGSSDMMEGQFVKKASMEKQR